jgi:hypothetical protein
MWTSVSEERFTCVFRVENRPSKKGTFTATCYTLVFVLLHYTISQKKATFIITAVRTSNRTIFKWILEIR